MGARHPINKPPDGLLSHEHDDPQQLDDKQTENEDIYDDDQQTVPDHSSNTAETGPGCEKFKQGDIRFHLTRDKTGQATLNLRKLSSRQEETGRKRESKITTMRRKMMESRKSKENQDARKVKVITNRVVKTYRGQKIIDARDVPENNLIQSEELVVVGSDVEALYPSLSDVEVAVICFNAVMESNIRFQNFDYRKGRIYIAMHMTEDEQRRSPLYRVLPRRTTRNGVRPGVGAKPGNEENWMFPAEDRTEFEERLIVAMATQIGVLTMMSTHRYSFAGKTYLQNSGGPIGLRATCAVARVVMNTWDTKWMEMMTTNNLAIITGVRYMDDIRAFLHAIRAGWRMWDGRLCFCEEWKMEDMKDGKSATRRTAEILLNLMNQIMPFLKFTMEIGEDFIDMKLPTLDVRIWIRNGRIEYDFFEKTMSTNTVLHAKTAQSEKTKFASLAQEVVRRLLHTSRTLPSSHRMENLEKFCQKMTNSGHNKTYIKSVIISGIEKYTKKYNKSILPSSHKDFKPLHLGTNFNTLGRWRNKMLEKNNWYKDQKDGKDGGKGMKKGNQMDGKEKVETTTVIFVPATRGGKLTEMLKTKEDELARITKFRVRYQEAGGTKLGLLFSTDLGAGDACGRLDCQPCESRTEKRPNCKAQSILYESKCVICNPSDTSSRQEHPRNGIYIGESSRSLYERSKEHLRDAESFDPGSHIIKHWMNVHPDRKDCPDFSFSIKNRFRDCLSRQVAEAISILYTKDQILNSKNEYMANCLTRICIEENRFEKKRNERQAEEQEEAEKHQLLAFKAKHMRPKRNRAEIQSTEEPLRKRMKLFLKAGNQQDQDDLDLETWLRKAEERCQRAGNLKTRLENEKLQVLEKMRMMKNVPIGWKMKSTEATGGPSHHFGEGAPLQQINTRACDHTSQNDENVPEGWKTLPVDGNFESGNSNIQMSNKAVLLGVAQGSSNESPKVPGNRNLGRQDENPEMKPQKSKDEISVVTKEHVETSGGPCHQYGGGAPLKQINTRACDLSDRSKKREERKKRMGNTICLTSYTAWWSRVEKDERRFYREVEKENVKREEKMKELKEKRKGKENFVRKFFPTCESSPGGTQRLITTTKPIDVSSARGRGDGKSVSGRSDLFPAKTSNFIINNSRTVSHNVMNEQKKKTSFEVFGGISRLSTDQSQMGMEPGDRDIRDG